jgi:hypothetical protein
MDDWQQFEANVGKLIGLGLVVALFSVDTALWFVGVGVGMEIVRMALRWRR